jgi:heterodisulfide reductase subunit C2
MDGSDNKPGLTVDFAQRHALEEILGAGHLGFCYQCGACVGDCPTARFDERFNPRTIMLQALIGDYAELIEENSIIWNCSNCYNCYERCPQDVRPVEVIMALKNVSVQRGTAAKDFNAVCQRVHETGRSVPVTSATNRMRAEAGLEPLQEMDTSEFAEILRPDEGGTEQ